MSSKVRDKQAILILCGVAAAAVLWFVYSSTSQTSSSEDNNEGSSSGTGAGEDRARRLIIQKHYKIVPVNRDHDGSGIEGISDARTDSPEADDDSDDGSSPVRAPSPPMQALIIADEDWEPSDGRLYWDSEIYGTTDWTGDGTADWVREPMRNPDTVESQATVESDDESEPSHSA